MRLTRNNVPQKANLKADGPRAGCCRKAAEDGFRMSYLFNTDEDRRQMLAAIGAGSVAELFASIPASLQLQRLLDLPAAMSELELTQHMQELAGRNLHTGNSVCFLGGGSYDHFIPAVVDALASRGEFYTSYTPYQPEVSQGNLQAMFQYQTMICQLTGMEVSNASLYDGGSATTEAALMALGTLPKRRKVVVLGSVHPEYREILRTYLINNDHAELIELPCPAGAAGLDDLAGKVDDQVACVIVQHPNFFGCLEDVQGAARLAHDAGAMLVQVFDPISLGILKRPGELGADIAVAEGQPLGNPLAYGGPYLGIMACQERFVRRMPGRIAGETVDRRGNRCWVLTLQTREQHIRRDKATSNICTNQGLFALRASIYLSLLGPHGMREVASLCLQKSHYAADRLTAGRRLERRFAMPFFKEFVLRDRQGGVAELIGDAQQAGVLAGLPLGRWYPEFGDCLLVAVTEQRTRQQIDHLAEAVAAAPTSELVSHA